MMTKKIANKILISGIVTLIGLQALAVCSVNADLSCSDPLINGRPAYSGIKWIFRSPYEKALLYGTTDVQNSRVSCIRFAQLMKTECGISDPVQFIFKNDADQISTSGYVTAPQPNLSELSDLDSSFKKYFSGALGVNVNKNLQDKTAQILNTEQMNLLNQFADPKSNSSRLEINMSCRAGESSSVNNLGCIYTVKCEALGAGGVGEKLIITKKPNVSSYYFCTKSNATNILMAIVQSANQNKDLSLPIPQSNFTTFENMPMISVNNSSLSSLLYTKWRISKYEWSELRLPASMAMMGDGLMPPLASAIDVPIDSIITAASVTTTTTTTSTTTSSTTVPSQIIEQPKPYTGKLGDAVTLKVKANKTVQYQWYFNYQKIDGATNDTYNFTLQRNTIGKYMVSLYPTGGGVLQSDTVSVSATGSCEVGGIIIPNNTLFRRYKSQFSDDCEKESETVVCENGALKSSLGYMYPSCVDKLHFLSGEAKVVTKIIQPGIYSKKVYVTCNWADKKNQPFSGNSFGSTFDVYGDNYYGVCLDKTKDSSIPNENTFVCDLLDTQDLNKSLYCRCTGGRCGTRLVSPAIAIQSDDCEFNGKKYKFDEVAYGYSAESQQDCTSVKVAMRCMGKTFDRVAQYATCTDVKPYVFSSGKFNWIGDGVNRKLRVYCNWGRPLPCAAARVTNASGVTSLCEYKGFDANLVIFDCGNVQGSISCDLFPYAPDKACKEEKHQIGQTFYNYAGGKVSITGSTRTRSVKINCDWSGAKPACATAHLTVGKNILNCNFEAVDADKSLIYNCGNNDGEASCDMTDSTADAACKNQKYPVSNAVKK